MAELSRWGGFVVGLVIVGATFSSVVGTIVLPKGVRSRISYAVWRGVKLSFWLPPRGCGATRPWTDCLGCLGQCHCWCC